MIFITSFMEIVAAIGLLVTFYAVSTYSTIWCLCLFLLFCFIVVERCLLSRLNLIYALVKETI